MADIWLNCQRLEEVQLEDLCPRVLDKGVWINILRERPELSYLPRKEQGLYLACMSAQSCLIFCDPMDCSPPGSSVHGIFQEGILEWVAISFPRGFGPGIKLMSPASPALAGGFFTNEPAGKLDYA